MFFRRPLKATPAKHYTYLIAATILGVFLSLLAHIIIETNYLRWAQDAGRKIVWYGGCSLHPLIQIGLLVVGAAGGFLIGRLWWRWLYIDHRWGKKPDSDVKGK
ncbi:MAG: hypothetical protein WCV50_04770 [Patescibacteria group bacterium]|jgi:hypothetical protein